MENYYRGFWGAATQQDPGTLLPIAFGMTVDAGCWANPVTPKVDTVTKYVGYHALKLQHACSKLPEYQFHAIGIVSLMGRVYECKYGYTAQQARVDSVLLACHCTNNTFLGYGKFVNEPISPQLADHVSDRYRCDVGYYGRIETTPELRDVINKLTDGTT